MCSNLERQSRAVASEVLHEDCGACRRPRFSSESPVVTDVLNVFDWGPLKCFAHVSLLPVPPLNTNRNFPFSIHAFSWEKKNLPPPEIIWGPLGSQSPVREPLAYEEEVVVDSLTDFPAACNVLIPNVKRVRYIPQPVGLPVDINDTVFHSYYICN